MNWALFAGGVSAALFTVWLTAAFRARPNALAVFIAAGFLVVAMMNAAAPVRGLVDPDYVGFRFGLIGAEKGLAVTVLAGGIFLLGAAGAFAALAKGKGAQALIAAACAFFLVILGVPWTAGALADISANTIQFGEYLTIPGALSTAIIFALIVLPFAAGLVRSSIALTRDKGLPAPRS